MMMMRIRLRCWRLWLMVLALASSSATSASSPESGSGGTHLRRPTVFESERPEGEGSDKLILLEPGDTGAVCLDGTPPGYYFRPGLQSTKYIIFYEGGAWCNSDLDCLARQTNMFGLGSSSGWAKYMDMANNVGGYFSTDPVANPTFHEWNAVYLKYCDGSSYSGYVEDALTVRSTKVYLRGRLVNELFIQDLLTNRGLDEATDVVLGGCSAGGLAVYLHVDRWAEALQGTGAKIRGLSDSGFFLNANLNSCQQAGYLRDTAELHDVGGGVNQACVRAYTQGKAGGGTHHCFFAQHLLPYIRTPVFTMQSAFDAYYIQHGSCLKPGHIQEVNDMGSILRSVFKDAHRQSKTPHGYLLDDCTRHCGVRGFNLTHRYDYWNGARGDSGKSVQEVFRAWYSGDTQEVEDYRVEATNDYPSPICPPAID